MTKGSKIENRWCRSRAAQYTFVNALRAVYGRATVGRPFLPLYEPPPDLEEISAQKHAPKIFDQDPFPYNDGGSYHQ